LNSSSFPLAVLWTFNTIVVGVENAFPIK
jgi:hypothetical protein